MAVLRQSLMWLCDMVLQGLILAVMSCMVDGGVFSCAGNVDSVLCIASVNGHLYA